MNAMGLGLRAVRVLASSPALDRLGVRDRVEDLLHRGTRDGFRAATAAGRAFGTAAKLARPARQRPARSADLFDLTPTDEQQMIVEGCTGFAAERLRPAAQAADAACAAPSELLAEAGELGLTALGVPEEAGGVLEERAAVTTVLAAEALAHGDLGLTAAIMAPAAVATAIGLWGDAEQQGTYLPALAGDEAPPAALAIMEPHAGADPFDLRTTARRDGGDWVLDGVKALVPRAGEAALLVVAARREDGGPGLFCLEPGDGVLVRSAPGLGARAAATGEVLLEGVRVPAGALLAEGDPDAYAECVRRSRIAWAALATGACRAVLDYLVPYVKERTAFGEPIAHRQSVAFGVADVAIETEGLRLATLRAAARADAGRPFAREAAAARELTARRAVQIGSQGVGLLGGHGYVKEHPVERWYRDLRTAGVMEGALLV
jgi:alkylation response protein AidB-like acyl-CoA dehydrogenase